MGLNDLVTVLVTVAVTVAVIAVALANGEEKRAFMRECQTYHNAHYACTAMWRGGITVLPVDVN